jgi:hypothetical protein
MQWIDDFIMAFGQYSDNSSYLPRDQKQLVRDYNNTTNQNAQNGKDTAQESFEMQSADPLTGEDFSIEMKLDKKPKDKREQEWIQREMTVTFTSLNNKDKFVSATLGTLCGGKYAHLAEKNIEEIASVLSNDINSIFNYADSSIASYADRINSDQAFRIAKSIAEKSQISFFDYEKICAKLNTDHLDGFNSMLKSANIKIAYPLSVLEGELNQIRMQRQAAADSKATEEKNKKVSYYVNLFKSFKEYKLADRASLKARIASVLPLISEDIKSGVVEELRKDAITRDII